jgi:predicted ribosomally synthesized peptide with nif11-like leader
MTSDHLQQLLTALRSDPALKARLAAATTVEEAIAIAEGAGIAVSGDDLLAARRLQTPELTDAELEAVAGGAESDKGSCKVSCQTDKLACC